MDTKSSRQLRQERMAKEHAEARAKLKPKKVEEEPVIEEKKGSIKKTKK